MKHREQPKLGMQPSILIASVLLLLILFICGGYFVFLYQAGLTPEQQAAFDTLQLRQAEWEDEKPPAFRYEVERSCDCPLDYIEPFTVVEYLDDPDNQSVIDDYFATIAAAMQDGKTVPVRYDSRFGFPNDFTLGEEDIFIRDFEVLEYADAAP